MIVIKDLDQQKYLQTWQAMQAFTTQRQADTQDEIWLVEHPPVFTLGSAGKTVHILDAHDIPVIKTDRGGQVTYHGPGQIVAYILLDINRRGFTIRQLVCLLEQAVINTLNTFHISALGKRDMPGVYINDKKIAAIGLRIKKNGCYHGLSFNIDMDRTPFSYINPCGYPNLTVAQLKDFVPDVTVKQIKPLLITQLLAAIEAQQPPIS